MLVSMKEILDIASKNNYAVAAPNAFSELDGRAYIEAAEELNAPLIIDYAYGTNPDIFTFVGLLRELAKNSKVPIAINLDHGGPKEHIIEAIRAGVTSVMVDRSMLSFEDNIKEVKEIVDIAHLVGVSVEAELGHVGQAQNYDVDGSSMLTTPKEAVEYIKRTNVDCLAVAIGTAHGAYPKGYIPKLDFERLKQIKVETNNFPLVMHGSSGTPFNQIERACREGINKVNVASDLCRAVVQSIDRDELDGQKAYSIYDIIRGTCKNKLKELIRYYGSENKAWSVEPKGISSITNELKES